MWRVVRWNWVYGWRCIYSSINVVQNYHNSIIWIYENHLQTSPHIGHGGNRPCVGTTFLCHRLTTKVNRATHRRHPLLYLACVGWKVVVRKHIFYSRDIKISIFLQINFAILRIIYTFVPNSYWIDKPWVYLNKISKYHPPKN